MALPFCKPKTKDSWERAGALSEVIKRWEGDKIIQGLSKGNTKYWKTFYEEVTKKDFDYGKMPSGPEIKKLDRKLTRMIKGLKKKPGFFAEWLYLPENILSKSPITKKYFNNMIYAGNFYRGNMEMFTADIDVMAKMIGDTAQVDGAMRLFKLNRKSAQRQVQDMLKKYKELTQTNPNQAEANYRDNLQKMSATEEQRIMQGVYDLIVEPSRLFVEKGKEGSLYDEFGTAAVQIARLWTGGKDSGQYTLRNGKSVGMRDKLYEILENGLKTYSEVMKDHALATGTFTETNRKMTELLTQFQKKKNFYPTQAMKIFPTLNKMSELIYDSNTSKALDESIPEINKMLDAVVKDLKLDPHTFLSKGDVERRSKDVISVIDQYAKDVIRFNYTSYSTKNVTKALQDLSVMRREPELEGMSDFLSNYVTETHSTAVGTRYKNTKMAHIARVITSWQFFNKLGLSPGTAARNATQSLQNFVYFGGKAWRDANIYAKSEGLGKPMQDAMKEHGVFFVNLEEIAQTGDMLGSVRLVDGEVVRNEPGFNEWFASTVEKAAKISGKPMQWVENKLNRAVTFKIAYATMHSELSKNNGIVRKRMETRRPEGKDIEQAIVDEIHARSSRYAANAVKELHYEYSPFAKPRVLQTSAGSILGQFSTYGINFFEYNRKIAVDAGDSMLAGDWSSPEAHRLYRLAMLYGLTTAVLEPLTNAKWSNLIQHDTKDRLEQLFDFMTGDEETKRRTFFGKGPILGTFGGPFVNDLFKLGNVIGFTKLSDNELINYMQGYQQKAKDVKDSRMQDAVGLLNQTLSKFVFSSMPKLRDGTGFMTILGQDYLHLWNTAEIKEKREQMLLYPQRYGPEILKSAFTPSEQKRTKLERLHAVKGKFQPTKTSRVKQESRAELLRSLDALSVWGR